MIQTLPLTQEKIKYFKIKSINQTFFSSTLNYHKKNFSHAEPSLFVSGSFCDNNVQDTPPSRIQNTKQDKTVLNDGWRSVMKMVQKFQVALPQRLYLLGSNVTDNWKSILQNYNYEPGTAQCLYNVKSSQSSLWGPYHNIHLDKRWNIEEPVSFYFLYTEQTCFLSCITGLTQTCLHVKTLHIDFD